MDQLSRDAKAARAAGLSYGQYIGRRYEAQMTATAAEAQARAEAKRQSEQERLAALPVCFWCGKPFEPRGRERICSPECRHESKKFRDRQSKERKKAEQRAAENGGIT